MSIIKKLVVAFDLDGTIIDATHRGRKKENGEWDIEYWLEQATYENIMNDRLMPLFEVYREFQKTGHTLICVTARNLRKNDLLYFEKHNITFDKIIHRDGSEELDHQLKDSGLQKYFKESGLIPYIAFDDKEDNLKVFDKYGFRTFNANYMNKKLEEGKFNPDLKPKDLKEEY